MIFIGYYFVSKIELNLHHIIRLKIYSTFFQLMCLVMYVEVPWPDAVKQFTQIFYALSFNIEITHPECAVSFNFFDKMKVRQGVMRSEATRFSAAVCCADDFGRAPA